MSHIPEHKHEHHCPITGASSPHAYCPPQKGDSRSPCPALNTLANHGYLPRDGKCIAPKDIQHALRDGYNLSFPLAWFLTRGGYYLLGQRNKHICLADLARHQCIEHNASLVHPDVEHRDEYAPLHPCPDMLEALLTKSADGVVMTPEDIARARVEREATYAHPLDRMHAEIARGEMAIVMHLFNNPNPDLLQPSPSPPPSKALLSRLKALFTRSASPSAPLPGVPLDALRTWMHHERLPDDWKPYHRTSLVKVVQMSGRIRSTMYALEDARKRAEARKERRQEVRVLDAIAPVTVEEAEEGLQYADVQVAEPEPEQEGAVGEDVVSEVESALEMLVPDSPTSATSDGSLLVTPTSSEFVKPPPPSGVSGHRQKEPIAVDVQEIEVPRIMIAA